MTGQRITNFVTVNATITETGEIFDQYGPSDFRIANEQSRSQSRPNAQTSGRAGIVQLNETIAERDALHENVLEITARKDGRQEFDTATRPIGELPSNVQITNGEEKKCGGQCVAEQRIEKKSHFVEYWGL